MAVLIGVHAEAVRAPITYTQYQGIPTGFDALPSVGDDAVLAFFPFYSVDAVFENPRYMLYATRSFAPMLNGYSGFTPQSYLRHARAMEPFPDAASIRYLRQVGVTHVVVESPLMSTTDDGVARTGRRAVYMWRNYSHVSLMPAGEGWRLHLYPSWWRAVGPPAVNALLQCGEREAEAVRDEIQRRINAARRAESEERPPAALPRRWW